MEDAKVAERALLIWPNVEKFVSSFKDPKKAPSSSSFYTVKESCCDPLIKAKLEFFVSVAKQLQPFLTKFQTDSPMVPFLGPCLKALTTGLMNRFLKKDLVEKADTYQKLASLYPKEKKKTKCFPNTLMLALRPTSP